jgi:hypothetical protein
MDTTCPFIVLLASLSFPNFWNKHHHENDNDNERHPFPSTYSQVKRKDVDQGLFIATESSSMELTHSF